jgi:SulP family sulfate permease
MRISWPESIRSLREYSLRTFFSDLVAGITVGMVALPLAMAFGISSGLTPQAGLYTAVVAGFLISALGGSTTQIGGPTGAFVVVVYGIVTQYGVNGLYLCTLMAGLMLLVMGLTGLGSVVKFIPRPVVIGFTNGIAVLIASTQIKDFFGLQIEKVPGDFAGRMRAIVNHVSTISAASTAVAVAALTVIVLCRRWIKRVPGSIAALVVCTVAVVAMKLPVESIGTRFGGIPSGLPAFAFPEFHAEMIGPLLVPAFTVAMLGAIESLLSAVVADRMSGGHHNPNVELTAQGLANIVSPLVGGLPATGAIARTATNIRSGAKTPIAGVIHALTLLSILVVAAPLAQYIPLAVLAAILMVVSYDMGEWREIPKLLKMTWADISVWVATFSLTVFADLTIAVEIGMSLAALLYIRKVTHTTTVSRVTQEYVEEGRLHVLQDKQIPDYVTLFRIHGPFLFGSSEKLQEAVGRLEDLAPIVIVRLRNMTAIDATGVLTLEEFAHKIRSTGRTLLVCCAQAQPAALLRQSHFDRHIGPENFCPNIAAALERARVIISEPPPARRSA